MLLDDDYAKIIAKIEAKYEGIREIIPFPMMYIGWELDNAGAVVVLDDNTRHLFFLGHNSLCEGDDTGLVEKIEEYREALAECERALAEYRVAPATTALTQSPAAAEKERKRLYRGL